MENQTNALNNMQVQFEQLQNQKTVCPNCGYCPHCGRGYHAIPMDPYPYTQPWIWYGTTTTGIGSSLQNPNTSGNWS